MESSELQGWIQILLPLLIQTGAIFWKIGRSEERLRHLEHALEEMKNNVVRKDHFNAELDRRDDSIRALEQRMRDVENDIKNRE